MALRNQREFNKICAWILNGIFLLLILTPGLGHLGRFFSLDYIYQTEKRSPHSFPEMPKRFDISKSYIDSLEAYLKDHFGFRSWLITMNNLIRFEMHSSGSNRVLIGKNDWLYLTDEDMIEQYRGIRQFNNDDIHQWVTAMDARKDWLASRHVPFIFAVAPNKCTIYPEYLPDWVTKVAPKTQLDQLAQAFDQDSDLDFLDLRPFTQKAKQKSPVYYRSDSHWNYHGGFAGYQAIMAHVARYFPNIRILSESEVNFSYVVGKGRDLAALLNMSDEIKEPFEDKYQFEFTSNVISTTRINDNPDDFLVKTRNTSAPKAIIFRDSYTDLMIPFFNESFSSVLYIRYDQSYFDKKVIEKFKPDIMMQIMVERCIRYRPYDINATRIAIQNWGPRTTKAGKKVNPQSDGLSAIWIVATRLSDQTVVVWNGTQLETLVYPDKGVVTAKIPDKLLAQAGEFPIYLYDKTQQEKSNIVSFKIYQ